MEVLVELDQVPPERVILELRHAVVHGRRPAASRLKILMSRSARSRAISGNVIGRPPVAGGHTSKPGPNALASLRSDSIKRKHVGNQTGPRQFELPPLIFSTASAGS